MTLLEMQNGLGFHPPAVDRRQRISVEEFLKRAKERSSKEQQIQPNLDKPAEDRVSVYNSNQEVAPIEEYWPDK